MNFGAMYDGKVTVKKGDTACQPSDGAVHCVISFSFCQQNILFEEIYSKPVCWFHK